MTDTPDYPSMTLDQLRRLADNAPEAKVRFAARREIEARVATAAGASKDPPTSEVVVSSSHYGTPRPEIRIHVPSARNRRDLFVVLHEYAAAVERSLSGTREAWHVELRRIDEREGAVYLELMDGHQAEVERAVAALGRVLGEDNGGRVRPRPRRERPAPKPVPAPAAPATDGEPELLHTDVAPPPAANDVPPPAADEVQAARAARRAYREATGPSARGFERRVLKRDRATLPECAAAVLDGGYRSAEYWTWLNAQFQAQEIAAVDEQRRQH